MNIFEEIAESYTYNGVVSMKALEDDIVTLENQLDSYNATLNELKIRGKKTGILVGKIRECKMRLSLLKSVLKREKDKASPDDIIKNVLEVSAKHANETESPETAANNRPPVPQNFEKAEIEAIDDNENSVAVEMEKFKVSDEVYDLTKATEEELDEFYATLTSDDTVFVLKDDETVEAENVAPVTDCPPLTIDDYFEPVNENESVRYYDENGEEITEVPDGLQ
jgi:hypothetical protein